VKKNKKKRPKITFCGVNEYIRACINCTKSQKGCKIEPPKHSFRRHKEWCTSFDPSYVKINKRSNIPHSAGRYTEPVPESRYYNRIKLLAETKLLVDDTNDMLNAYEAAQEDDSSEQ